MAKEVLGELKTKLEMIWNILRGEPVMYKVEVEAKKGSVERHGRHGDGMIVQCRIFSVVFNKEGRIVSEILDWEDW